MLAQKFDYPETEQQLRDIQDKMYDISRKYKESASRPSFKGLMEIIKSDAVIISAIHNIKSNKGSQTPGIDNETMQHNILNMEYTEVIMRVKELLTQYKPIQIKRTCIPKPGKKEMRQLGIPTIIDRIVQECIRIVIEPIFEAQFYKHSYGFRPMRGTDMALETAVKYVALSNQYWFIEGDIKKFFDTVNHRILLKRLWHMGIRDKRLLMIIKEMLKAGIMEQTSVNELGLVQGGILSPLLANVYLDIFDQWIVKQWTNKKTRYPYKDEYVARKVLKRDSNLQPMVLVRYCDDWVILTDTKQNAEKLKVRVSHFLKEKLKLDLSLEKTVITNVKKKCIKFLGFEFKVVKGKSRTGFVVRTMPDRNKVRQKVDKILEEIKKLKTVTQKEQLIHKINIVNSKIRGIINYYIGCTWVNVILGKLSRKLQWAGHKLLNRVGGKWVKANETNNLQSIHQDYTVQIPAIEYKGVKVGLTSLEFCRWNMTLTKNQKETPYSSEGRNLNFERTKKKPLKVRADELLNLEYSELIGNYLTDKKYNFEYFMNRAYAFNRDKGKCRVCRTHITSNVHIHHINPNIGITKVNKVLNLATMHDCCHQLIHSNNDYSNLESITWNKITGFREKLNGNN